ncbi:MAG: histidine kinase dimerization/phospho-acceptor domain-containing protein, partial [Planctomycetota bacterium]
MCANVEDRSEQSMADQAASNLEAEVKLLKDELVETQRMAALGELAGTTAHEFNNILMTILNYAKLGLRHKDDATRTKSLEKILASAQRAEKVVNSVLATARNRQQDFAPIDLERMIEDALVLLEREMQKYRVTVIRQFGPAPPVRAI